jgi:hypothetical protein
MMHESSHWKGTIYIYNHKKFQKIQQQNAFTAACPKTKRAILALKEL